ncbi:MAG: hypothetical protein OXF08_06500 [Bacteroidetes bacterium]|nr:hypothetical protein [Bacteroidota bacterium]
MRIKKSCWGILVLLLTLTAQAQDQIRVLQESPWLLSPVSSLSQPVRPVAAFLDPDLEAYFIDVVAVFTALNMKVDTPQMVVKATNNQWAYEVDFAGGTFLRQSENGMQHSDTLITGGYFLNGERYLLTPSNLERIFPLGALTYDIDKLILRPSQVLFADEFRPQVLSPRLGIGPMLYGRNRRFIGGTQLGYRFNRTHYSGRDIDYTGFLSVRASALWGQLRADATTSYSGTTTLRQFSYTLDFPRSAYLTQFALGRANVNQWPVRQTYEGIQMSNRPLSTRHQQREAKLDGVAEPNALVSALVGGVVASRVQADGQGRYQLSVPAYYGTSGVELEIVPANGGIPTRQTRYLLITEDLLPSKTLYWDLQAGRNQYDHSASYGQLRLSYGISDNITTLGSFSQVDSIQAASLGIVTNIGGSTMFSGEVVYPNPAFRATLQWFSRQFQLQTEAEMATEPGLTYYRQRFVGRAGWNVGGMSLFINGTRFESFGGNTTMQLDGSGTFRLSRRISLIFAGGPRMTQFQSDTPSDTRIQWRTSLTRYSQIRGVRGRIGFQGQGGRYESFDFAGLTVHASYRRFSFGARIGYNIPAEAINTSISIRMNAPWAGFSSHTVFEPNNPYNQQSFYGSMSLSRGLLFSRESQLWSSALLRPFVDTNRDGRRNQGEIPYDGLDLNVMRARTEADGSGTFRADYLVPSTQYQVVIDPRSIEGPELDLPTGTSFSFLSDPGETKYIEIPIHRNTIVTGVLENLPLSSPTLAVVIFYQGQTEVLRAAVSQQGQFTALLPPGSYRVELIDLLGVEDLSGYTQILEVQPVRTQSFQIR